jgi:hypothetical protein
MGLIKAHLGASELTLRWFQGELLLMSNNIESLENSIQIIF